MVQEGKPQGLPWCPSLEGRALCELRSALMSQTHRQAAGIDTRLPELLINLLFTASTYARLTEGIIFRGSEGGRLEIKCKYDCERKLNNKYFCRHPCNSNEHVIIKSSKPETLTINDRFSIFDHTSSCYFTVMVDKARATDSGRHYCGIEVFLYWDDYTEVLIDVTRRFCLRQGSAVQPT